MHVKIASDDKKFSLLIVKNVRAGESATWQMEMVGKNGKMMNIHEIPFDFCYAMK